MATTSFSVGVVGGETGDKERYSKRPVVVTRTFSGFMSLWK